jgi:hypothetical protein
MDNIDEIFKLPNSIDNLLKRVEIMDEYKALHNIPDGHGVNICEVIKWAKKKNT